MSRKLDGFMRGVNLGGWLSQCKPSKEQYDSFITEDDIKTIKSWGLDHVRLPVDYELVQEKDGTFKESGFAYIKNAIDWCKNAGLNLILDLHKAVGYSFYEGTGEKGFFDEPEYQELFYSLWAEFAVRYGHYEDMLCFELLNEVTKKEYSAEWNRIARTCIARIRKSAPTIRILVGSYWNNHVMAVRDLEPPYDENIVYNFHCYEPLIFTHQGAHWITTMNTKFRMPLLSTWKEYAEYTAANVNQEGDNFSKYDANDVPDESYFENLFADAIKVAEERNVELYCGEYGVIENAEPEETVKWYKLINAVFEKHSIGRAAWSYKKMNFGIADERMNDVRKELLKLL
ncbi:MAG: glycoside hydrolase family 5 protein [Treponemataceae bacterium]|nr:glycoside hydrolase family 5 protein [Treponemataceae bacterium]